MHPYDKCYCSDPLVFDYDGKCQRCGGCNPYAISKTRVQLGPDSIAQKGHVSGQTKGSAGQEKPEELDH